MTTADPLSRDHALALDAADPLERLREQFVLPEGLIYLDGNSLGVLPRRTATRVQQVVQDEWGQGLIGSWNHAGWIDLPQRVGDKIARLVGAGAGELVVADSTSVNLFKVLSAALMLARVDAPQRRVILSERSNFPTDLYIAESLAQQHGCTLVLARRHSLTLDERLSAYASRGSVYNHRGQSDFAIADFDAYLRLKTDNGVIYNNRGVAYARKGMTREAMADYAAAIRLHNAVARLNRAELLISQGQWDAARATGMSYTQSLLAVVLPQAVRLCVPPLANRVIVITKNTALGTVIGVPEILNQATTATSFSGNATPLMMGAIAYVVLFVPVVILGRWLETRFAWRRA